jgi:hypothetical protein
MDELKINEKKKDLKKQPNISTEIIDTSAFDETLIQIEKTLSKLSEKVDHKQDLTFDEKPQVEINYNNNEHAIDNTHLRMEELHDFSSVSIKKNKNSIGFYTYLALIVGVVFAIYEILNSTKDLLISKYPSAEPYIEYFYEIIEILAYLVMNSLSFIKNLF